MNTTVSTLSIQKACDLISGDMNIFISQQQMVDLLSKNLSLFEVVNDGALSGLFSPSKNNPLLIDFNNPENYSFGRAPNVASHSGIVPVVQKLVFNHLSISLLSKPMPTVDEIDRMEDGLFSSFCQELQDEAVNQGYKYSTHPDGPDAEKDFE